MNFEVDTVRWYQTNGVDRPRKLTYTVNTDNATKEVKKMDKQELTRHIRFVIQHFSQDSRGYRRLDSEQQDAGHMFNMRDADILKKQLEYYLPGMVWDGSGGYSCTGGRYILLTSAPDKDGYSEAHGYFEGELTDDEEEALANAYYPF